MSQVTQLETEPVQAESAAAPPRPAHSLRRFQAMVACIILLVFLAPYVFICLWARSDTLARWESRRLMDREDRAGLIRMNVGNYYDAGDKMLLHDLPSADYSHPGVFVMGASSAIYCLDDYGLPPEEAKYIHTYGIYSLNHHQLFQLTQWLNDYWGLFKAGGDNNMIMIGLAYSNCVEPPNAGTYFPYYFKRSGVFDYDYDRGIRLVPMSPIERFVHLEDARARSVVHRWMEDPELIPRHAFSPATYRDACVKRMGPDWAPVMGREIADLGRELDYLEAHHVHVIVFRVPEGSWNAGIPARDRYVRESDRILAERGMKAIDMTHLCPDSDFNDPVHLRPSGTRKTEAVLLPLARDFLRNKGVLPPATAIAQSPTENQ